MLCFVCKPCHNVHRNHRKFLKHDITVSILNVKRSCCVAQDSSVIHCSVPPQLS